MEEFRNVTVVKKANIYFDGAVASRTVLLADGARLTLGVMQPGEYTFTTGVAEIMEIIAGDLRYRVGDSGDWLNVHGGESFTVPANSSFTMQVATVSDYCCTFLPE